METDKQIIATRLMGWEIRKRGRRVWNPVMGQEISGFSGYRDSLNYIDWAAPGYATGDIAAALDVIAAMAKLGWGLIIIDKETTFAHDDFDRNKDCGWHDFDPADAGSVARAIGTAAAEVVRAMIRRREL